MSEQEKMSRRSYLKYSAGLVAAAAIGAAAGYGVSESMRPPVGPAQTVTVTETVGATASPTVGPYKPPLGKYPWEVRPAEYYQAISPNLKQLNLYIDFAGFSTPAIEDQFIKTTGISNGVKVDVYTSEMDMYAKIKAGGHGYDNLHIHFVSDPKNPNRHGLWRTAQIDRGEGPFLEPLDMKVMSNMQDGFIPSTEFWEKTCKWDGKWYCIPQEVFIDSMAYLKDYVSTEEASSIELLWNPKYRNKIGMPNYFMSVVVAGIYTGAETPWNQTLEELEKSRQALLEQKKLVRAYWTGAGDLEALFSAKEVYAAFSWYACIVNLLKAGFPIGWSGGLVEEGTIVGACHHGVSSQTNNKYEAMLWLNYNCSEERGVPLYLGGGYPPASKNAYRNKQVFDERMRELWGIDEMEQIFENGHYYSYPDHMDKYTEIMAEVLAA